MFTKNSLQEEVRTFKSDSKLKILHLEDVYSDALLISKAIKKGNIDVEILVVDTKNKFIQALDEFSPDVILADHSLPSFNSVEALELFRENGIKIPFILVTAAMSDEFAAGIIMKGADDYILKDRLYRLPMAILKSLDKFRFERERKFFVTELVKKEKRYRSLVEHSGDGVVILNKNGQPTFVSPSVKGVLGYTEEELKQLDLFAIAHPDDILSLQMIMNHVLANPGIPIKGHTGRMLHKDGSWRWIEATVTNMLHDPSINGIVDNFRDITERKLAELAIKESEEKYRSFFENSMDGILLTVTDGKILEANPAACAIFGMSEEEICAIGRFGLVDNTDPRVAAALKERQGKGRAKAEVTLIRKNGEHFPGELSSVVYKNTTEEQRTSMIVRDISERKLAEKKIIQLSRLYSFLSQINQTIVHANDEKMLFKEVCRIAIEIGRFKAAWIGKIDVEHKRLQLINSYGDLPENFSSLVNKVLVKRLKILMPFHLMQDL